MTENWRLLSYLWLHEPGEDVIRRAVSELGLPPAAPSELAAAYADLFLLNVFPYGTVFTDPEGELNGPEARSLASLYELHGYRPPELKEVGAPDHLGLCLGFWAEGGQDEILPYILKWAPVCCLAVEREPAAHSFYRSLATSTREMLMATTTHLPSSVLQPSSSPALQPLPPNPQPPLEELGLPDLLRFFLTPAQCGLFLSRARLGQIARSLNLGLPFGSRWQVAEGLWRAAGANGRVAELLDWLSTEMAAWAATYHAWADAYPAWMPYANEWLARTQAAETTLVELRYSLVAASND